LGVSKEILLEEFAKIRGIMPRAKFAEYISKKYGITAIEAKKEINKYCNVYNLSNNDKSEDGKYREREHAKTKWGEENIKKLIILRKAGKTNKEIAIALDSTEDAVSQKVSDLIHAGRLESKYKKGRKDGRI
jgi:DNA-binding NarL/FixJ family response regulator